MIQTVMNTNIKKIVSVVLAMAMAFAACVMMCGCEKKPSSDAGTEEQQAMTKAGYEFLRKTYDESLKGYVIRYSSDCYFKANDEPTDYGINEERIYYSDVVARIYYIWQIQNQLVMRSVVYFKEDGTLDYYTYMYEDMARAAAQEQVGSGPDFGVLNSTLEDIYYNQFLDMNELLIPTDEEIILGWTRLDISHLL